jgi:hypothetical protein
MEDLGEQYIVAFPPSYFPADSSSYPTKTTLQQWHMASYVSKNTRNENTRQIKYKKSTVLTTSI